MPSLVNIRALTHPITLSADHRLGVSSSSSSYSSSAWMNCVFYNHKNKLCRIRDRNQSFYFCVYLRVAVNALTDVNTTNDALDAHTHSRTANRGIQFNRFLSIMHSMRRTLSHTHIHSLGTHNELWKFESQRSASASAALPPNDLCNKMNENRDKSEIGQFLPQLNTI